MPRPLPRPLSRPGPVRAQGLVFDPSPPRLVLAGALSRLRPGLLAPVGSPLALREVEVKESFGSEWAILKPRFVGICGSDLMQAQLRADADNPLSGLISFPHVMGHEIVAQAAEDASWVVVDPWLGCVARGIVLLFPLLLVVRANVFLRHRHGAAPGLGLSEVIGR